MEDKFQELLKQVKSYNDNLENVALIEKAWEFAKLAHADQKRLTGDPYVSHVLAVAQILADWKLDTMSVVAGLLHDSVEDGGATLVDLENEFNGDVSFLVNGVTKVSKLSLGGNKEEEFVENLRKMFLAMAKDLRVVFIKLADRLHNMQTLSALSEEKQTRIAQETLDIFAPLAERLGMGQVKGQLEDLSFPYAFPDEFKRLAEKSKIHYKQAEEHIKRMKRTLLRRIAEENIQAKIHARKKHLFSLWKKLQRPEILWDFEKVNDIVALRILVDTVSECYTALGIVHHLYKPVPHVGISDFIAQPKPNGYQSIHTKVFGPGGRIVEVQIRTFEMHEQAEHGAAAHWAYAQAKSQGATDQSLEKGQVSVAGDKLTWVKQLERWQEEISDSEEFLEAVKFDALNDRIYVFTPKGDVYDLPTGATPIDFAYNVHTNLANYMRGATVNGAMVPLSKKLKNGDVVEILKLKNPVEPKEDWLSFVATTTARRQIQKHLRKHE